MLQSLLNVGIFIPTRPLSQDEINHLILKEEVANLGLKRFLKGQISFNDYLDVLEVCNVDVDDYLQTVDENCALVM